MAGAAWSEEGSPDEGVTFRFDGFDGDAREATEVTNVARVMRWTPQTRSKAPAKVRRSASLALLLLTAPWLAFLAHTKPLSFTVSFFLVAALLAVPVLVQRLLVRPSALRPDARFTLRITPTQLVCAGERMPARTFELSNIDAVVGGERLIVRLRDGTSATLPACLPDRDHRALAHAVEERIAEVRAAHAGYRGEGERLRIAAVPEEEDAAQEDAAQQEAEQEQAEQEHRARGHAR
jgi:hypothetical protein